MPNEPEPPAGAARGVNVDTDRSSVTSWPGNPVGLPPLPSVPDAPYAPGRPDCPARFKGDAMVPPVGCCLEQGHAGPHVESTDGMRGGWVWNLFDRLEPRMALLREFELCGGECEDHEAHRAWLIRALLDAT